ncbi:MAG TPA: response regulator [Bryobacteraceae bacterium]|nr:response regulator [Bryobacteraceae bacterium]
MSNLQEKLFGIFRAEHAEHLQHIRSILAMAEQVEGGASGGQLDEAFRRAHSLKGAARAVDIRPVEGLAHRLETLLARIRDGTLRLDPPVIRVIHQVLDASEDCMAAIGENKLPSDPAGALRAIEQLLGLESAPSGGEPQPSEALPGFSLQPVETVRISGENLDQVMRSADQMLTQAAGLDLVTGQLRETSRGLEELNRIWEQFRETSALVVRGGDAPTYTPLLIRTMDGIGERVRNLSQQSRSIQLGHRRSAWTMRHLAGRLQQDVWRARLVPADAFFEGLGKMVRDLARDEQKEIAFRMHGGGVHADRLVLQSLKDPVMHLLRNAVSHGLEPPAERVRNGKAPGGSLTLGIESNERSLKITVADDGRGLDLKRVAEAALERRLFSSEDLSRKSPGQIARLIFEPGFSTAKVVNDLSGRGMGLSVVYETTRRLQGNVDVQHADGSGTTMTLTVPVSISTCHLVFVSSQSETFAVPSHGIVRLCHVKRKEVQTLQGRLAVTVDGAQHFLFSLAQLLGLATPENPVERDTLVFLLLGAGGRRGAVVVDKFLFGKDAPIQDLGMHRAARGITGGVLLDDGKVALTLNPVSLIEACSQGSGLPAPSLDSPAGKPVSSILVVDDSITTRSLEKSILEAHGYRVRVAVDGVDALESLRVEPSDLVITDVQMPRMDGFGLVEALKADPRLRKIPIIVVSSLERAEDKERGLHLGADAYIVKRKFDQHELLDAVQQMI